MLRPLSLSLDTWEQLSEFVGGAGSIAEFRSRKSGLWRGGVAERPAAGVHVYVHMGYMDAEQSLQPMRRGFVR